MKNRNESDELWSDLLDDVASQSFRQTMLTKTIRTATRRNRRRTVGAITCIVVPLLLLALAQLRDKANVRTDHVAAAPKSVPVVSARAAAPAVEQSTFRPTIITDEELFDLFPNQAMALVGRPGQQRLVVLGERLP